MKLIYRIGLFIVILLSGFSALAQKPGEQEFGFKATEVTQSKSKDQTTSEAYISEVLLQPDKKIIVAGRFSNYAGTPCLNIIRLNNDGTIDPSFNFSSVYNTRINTIGILPDGQIVIGGYFSLSLPNDEGTRNRSLVRLKSNGILDSTFLVNFNIYTKVYTVEILPDGKILVGGDPQIGLSKLNSDGSLDQDFNQGILNDVIAISVLPNGKIIVGGGFKNLQFVSSDSYREWRKKLKKKRDPKKRDININLDFVNRNSIARLNSNGSLDYEFDPGSGAQELSRKYKHLEDEVTRIYSITRQSDEKIIITGAFTHYDSVSRNRIARIDPNGSLDETFNPGAAADSTILKTALQADGKILIAGMFSSFNGTPRNGLARLNADGSLDKSFNPDLGPQSIVNDLVQTENKLIIVGSLIGKDGTRSSIMRLYLN